MLLVPEELWRKQSVKAGVVPLMIMWNVKCLNHEVVEYGELIKIQRGTLRADFDVVHGVLQLISILYASPENLCQSFICNLQLNLMCRVK